MAAKGLTHEFMSSGLRLPAIKGEVPPFTSDSDLQTSPALSKLFLLACTQSVQAWFVY